MEKVFTADKITYETNVEDNYDLIGFSDNGNSPKNYLIIQKALSFDDQDIEMGMDTYYLEFSHQRYSGYGVCQHVLLFNDYIVFKIKEHELKNIDAIKVYYNVKIMKSKATFIGYLKKIFQDILQIQTQ
jgi:hypothetical protein